MVKIHCDRCGAEIKDKYYTVNIYSHDTHPKYDYCATADCACSSSRDDILRTLNATKMYCMDCKNKIEAFVNQCEV